MLYDLIAAFYEKELDSKPRYRVPLGLTGRSGLEGFEEDPDSTPGYTDYILRNASEEDLQRITRPHFISEAADVLYSNDYARIDIFACELDALDDEGSIAPRGLMISDTFVKFTETEALSPVYFSEGERCFQVPLKKLKDYFEVLTLFEVMARLDEYFAKGNPWSFEELKDYFEAGVDDAVDLASRTLFGLRDARGVPRILAALEAGLAGKGKYEMVAGFLKDAVRVGELTKRELVTYGYSEEVIALLSFPEK